MASDKKPWLKPVVYYARRYIPGYIPDITLNNNSAGKNVVTFNTYDHAGPNRTRSVYSALPKVTNIYQFKEGSSNLISKGSLRNLTPLSGATLEVWGYNFAEIPFSKPHINVMSIYVSGSPGVFNNNEYVTVDRFVMFENLSARNPVFEGIPVDYELIPTVDKSRSIIASIVPTMYYTRKNKLKMKLPDILSDTGCIDIIVMNAAGYSTLSTLAKDYVCV